MLINKGFVCGSLVNERTINWTKMMGELIGFVSTKCDTNPVFSVLSRSDKNYCICSYWSQSNLGHWLKSLWMILNTLKSVTEWIYVEWNPSIKKQPKTPTKNKKPQQHWPWVSTKVIYNFKLKYISIKPIKLIYIIVKPQYKRKTWQLNIY